MIYMLNACCSVVDTTFTFKATAYTVLISAVPKVKTQFDISLNGNKSCFLHELHSEDGVPCTYRQVW